jgi:hypothetical protein
MSADARISLSINYTFKYDPNYQIMGYVLINGTKYPYTEIIKEEPEQLDLWGNKL